MIVMDQQTAKALAKLIGQIEAWESLDARDLTEDEVLIIRRFVDLVDL